MATSTTEAREFLAGRRWYVMSAIFLLSFITIVDRVAISASKSAMSLELGISNLNFGYVFGAFAAGYALFMIPGGYSADRLGPRLFLAITVGLWSVFTLATGLVQALGSLVAVRLAFGMAEAGAYPTAARAIYNWFPARERGLALGLLNTGSRLGAAFGLTMMPVGVVHLGWRVSYYLLGVAGVAWAGIWYALFRDRPEGAPRPASAWKGSSNKRVWRSLFRSKNFYLILIQYFALNVTFFVCFSWLLPYTQDHYQLSAEHAGFYASIPLYCGALATWLGGLSVDTLFRMGHRRISRAAPAVAGFGLAAASLMLGARVETLPAFIGVFAAAMLGVDFTISASYAVCADVGREYTGTLSALMNMMGSLGAFCSSLAFPRLLEMTGGPRAYFQIAAALNVVAIICWIQMRPDRALNVDDPICVSPTK